MHAHTHVETCVHTHATCSMPVRKPCGKKNAGSQNVAGAPARRPQNNNARPALPPSIHGSGQRTGLDPAVEKFDTLEKVGHLRGTSIHMSTHMSTHMSLRASAHMSIHMPIHMSTHMLICIAHPRSEGFERRVGDGRPELRHRIDQQRRVP